ncbi:hypothetical protein BLA13014_07782 [Burkholderia aenigmatica]|uniref:Uncharacterized protein n=1 Tax=Burkholderia aenigmatica TaxID=2015348 RepID=A0A6P2T0U8_9BURK|nr:MULTISPECIES: hypothetical protein [Burkholderia]VWC51089.1 hypothetical protein BLA13014_07782 [Burkholderia aenigmatica]
MEPLWEYQWEFVQYPYEGAPVHTGFWMTDEEAEHWEPGKHHRSRRLDETRRDRNVQPKPPIGLFPPTEAPPKRSTAERPLPAFRHPDLQELRLWWIDPRSCTFDEIHRLILEVVRLRRQLDGNGK